MRKSGSGRRRSGLREPTKACLLIMTVLFGLWASGGSGWAGQDEKAGSAASNGSQAIPNTLAAAEGSPDLPRPDLEVIARVNGDPVSRFQFDQMVGNPITLRQAQREFGTDEPTRKNLEKTALERLIDVRLLVQEAGRRKIDVAQKELDQTVSAISHRFESLKDFGAWMKDQGLNDPLLFETIKTDILAERATEALAAEVTLTDEETSKYFEEHKDDFILGAEVRLRIIAVRSKAEADQVLGAISKGVPFDRLARRRSVGHLAAKGGDTGWVNFQNLPAILQTAISELKPGQVVSEPIEKSEEELLIVALQDRRPILAKTPEEARRLIEERLLPAKKAETLQAWLKARRATAKIELLLSTLELCSGKPINQAAMD